MTMYTMLKFATPVDFAAFPHIRPVSAVLHCGLI